MFANEVWPEDFYTHANGQMVYLSWPVPECHDGCSSNWIGDRYCDPSCNVAECDFDGGDCIGRDTTSGSYGTWQATQPDSGGMPMTTDYCSASCPDSWIGDRYCDRSCLSEQCGFDSGDCGMAFVVDNLHIMHIDWNTSTSLLPPGIPSLALNLTALLTAGRITDAYHDSLDVVRSATISQVYHLMTVTLRRIAADRMVSFTIVVDVNGTMQEKLIGLMIPAATIPMPLDNATAAATQLPDAGGNRTDLSAPPPQGSGEADARWLLDSAPDESQYGNATFVTAVRVKETEDSFNYWVAAELSKLAMDPSAHDAAGIMSGADTGDPERDMAVVAEHLLEVAQNRTMALLESHNVSTLPHYLHQDVLMAQVEFASGEITLKGLERRLWRVLKAAGAVEQRDATDSASPLTHATSDGAPEMPADAAGAAGGAHDGTAAERLGGPLRDPLAAGHAAAGGRALLWLRLERDGADAAMDSLRLVPLDAVAGRRRLAAWPPSSVTAAERYAADWIADSKRKQLHLQRDLLRMRALWEEQHGEWTGQPVLPMGAFPWETAPYLLDDDLERDALRPTTALAVENLMDEQRTRGTRRQLLDAFADSLKYVNRLYNKEFGTAARRVPAHMPHMIDVSIMRELQARYGSRARLAALAAIRRGGRPTQSGGVCALCRWRLMWLLRGWPWERC